MVQGETGWHDSQHMNLLPTDLHGREWVLDYLALGFATIYSYLVRVPKWLLYMMSGGVATFLINLLHKPKAQERSRANPEAVPKQPATPPTVVPKAEAKTTATNGQKTPSKRRGKR